MLKFKREEQTEKGGGREGRGGERLCEEKGGKEREKGVGRGHGLLKPPSWKREKVCLFVCFCCCFSLWFLASDILTTICHLAIVYVYVIIILSIGNTKISKLLLCFIC